MRTTKWLGQFKRDYKREMKGKSREDAAALDAELRVVLETLAAGRPLDQRYRDHPLKGEWKDHRDCHVRPDLVLIYRKPDNDSLELVRLGSHSDLGI